MTAGELMALLADVPPETVLKICYDQFAEADVDAVALVWQVKVE